MKKNNFYRKALSITLAVSMLASQMLGVIPVSAANDEPTQGVFVEYFDQYDRRTDYDVDPYDPTPGSTVNDYNSHTLTHSGIPDGIPATWSYIDDDIDDYWGDAVSRVQAIYEGENLATSDNFFGVRYSAILTTPDFDGTYYFKVNANDGKAFRIYDAEGETLLAEYVHWNGSGTYGIVNTGSTGTANTTDGVQSGFELVNWKNDVLSIALDAETEYYIEYDFCEGLSTAFAKLHWEYGEDADGSVFINDKTDGLSDTDTIIPDEYFTLAPQHDGVVVQGYVYDEDGNAAEGVEMTAGDATAVSEKSGYYCLIADSADVAVTASTGDYVGAGVAEDGVVASIYLEEADVVKYTVTFNIDGEKVTELVKEGNTVAQPEDPTKAGYEFVEWVQHDVAYDFDTPVTEDIFIYASFRAVNVITVTVTVQVSDDNGGVCEGAMVTLGDQIAYTDENGIAVFTEVPEGDYTVRASADGMTSYTEDIAVAEDSADIEVTATIQEYVGPTVAQWDAVEIDIEGIVPDDSNAFMDTAGKVNAVFTNETTGTTASVNAFYRDNGVWTIRFSPSELGVWSFEVQYDESNDYVYADDYYDPDKELPVDESEQYDDAYGAIFDGISGYVTCVENDNELMHGGVIRDPDNLDHFIYQDGTPYFLSGYEVDWMGMIDQGKETGDIEGAQAMIDMMIMMGYNEVQMNAFGWDTSWCDGNNGKSYGTDDTDIYDFGPCDDFPWKTFDGYVPTDDDYNETNADLIDFTQMNESYWAKMDEVVAAMTANGITAHFFWKVYNKMVVYDNGIDSGWSTDALDYQDEPWLTYSDTMFARYFRDRYSAYNVIFDMGKESYNIGWTAASLSNHPDTEGGGFYTDTMIREFREFNDYYDRIITIHDYDTYYTYLNYTATESYYDTTNGEVDMNGDMTEMVQMVGDQVHLNSGLGSNYDYTIGKKASFPDMPHYNVETNYQQSNYTPHYNTYSAGNDEWTAESALRDYCELNMAGAYWAHYYTNHAWDVVKYEEVPEQWQYFANLTSFISEDIGTAVWAQMDADDSLITDASSGASTYYVGYGLIAKHAMATEGTNYLVYVGYGTDDEDVAAPDGMDSVTMTFSGVDSDKPLIGYWYNVMTDETQAVSQVIYADGDYTFERPTTGWSTVLETNGFEQQGSGESYFLYFSASEEDPAGDVVSVMDEISVDVKYGTDLADVEAQLPTDVIVYVENGAYTGATVTWDTTSYVAEPADGAAATYTFTGTLSVMAEDVTNSADVVATATINMREYIEEYTVSFVTDGGTSYEDVIVEEGQSVAQPEDPTRTDDVFLYWYADDSATAYDFDTALSANVELTALWRSVTKVDVTINVLATDDTGAEGAVVTLYKDDEVVTTVTADATGVVVLEDVIEGSYTVIITMDGMAPVTRYFEVIEDTTPAYNSMASYSLVVIESFSDIVINTYMVPATIESGLVRTYYNGSSTSFNLDCFTEEYQVAQENVIEEINFNFGSSSPDEDLMGTDYYGIKYEGQLYAPVTGTYTFLPYSNDGFRLTVAGTKLGEATGSGINNSSYTIYLEQGYHDLEYMTFEWVDSCQMMLSWTIPGGTSEIIPATYYFLPDGEGGDVITYANYELDGTLDVGTSFADSAIVNGDYVVDFADGTTGTLAVTWDEEQYAELAQSAGTKLLYGTFDDLGENVLNPGELNPVMEITFVGELDLTPAATAFVEVDSIDTAAGTTVFNVKMSDATNLRGFFFTLANAADFDVDEFGNLVGVVVEGAENFSMTELEAGVYVLIYDQGGSDLLTTSEETLVATITVAGADGAEIAITNVMAVNAEPAIGEQSADVTIDSASSVELFAEAIEKYDLNGDGVVNYADITAIVPYWGFEITTGEEDYAKYDVTDDDKINSADYLMVFSKIEVETED